MVAIAVSFTVMLVWKFREPAPSGIFVANSLPNAERSNKFSSAITATEPTQSGVGKAATEISDLSKQNNLTSSTPATDHLSKRATPLDILGGGNFRKLIESNRLTNIDYAIRRLAAMCTKSLSDASDRKKTLDNLSLRMAEEQKPSPDDPSRLGVGKASFQQRVASLDELYEFCNKSFEGALLKSDEYARVNTRPDVQRFRAIDKAANPQVIDLSNIQTKEALETVVTTPLYATLQGILISHLDFSTLAGNYSQEQIATLGIYASQIIVCRLGDDCGSNGYMTLFACQYGGICGNNFEEAVWDHLKDRNIDTRALRQFIDQRQQALSLLDFSILKKSK